MRHSSLDELVIIFAKNTLIWRKKVHGCMLWALDPLSFWFWFYFSLHCDIVVHSKNSSQLFVISPQGFEHGSLATIRKARWSAQQSDLVENARCNCCAPVIIAIADICIATYPDLNTCVAILIKNFQEMRSEWCTNCIDGVLGKYFPDFVLTDGWRW